MRILVNFLSHLSSLIKRELQLLFEMGMNRILLLLVMTMSNQIQYKLPENFKEIYADMTKQCTEDKKEDAKKREQQMLSSITGIAVESITDWSKKKTIIVPLRKKQSVTRTQKKKESKISQK